MIGSVRRQRILSLLLVAGVVFALDQYSKYWLIHEFGIGQRPPVRLCEYFALVLAWNTGVSFSMLAHSAQWMPWALVALALVISGILVRLCLASDRAWERVGYAMVVGGAMGNAIDRIRYGAVADFFYAHVGEHGFPAFNVADMAICGGVGLLLLHLMKKPATA
jgi:signal peptidase II